MGPTFRVLVPNQDAVNARLIGEFNRDDIEHWADSVRETRGIVYAYFTLPGGKNTRRPFDEGWWLLTCPHTGELVDVVREDELNEKWRDE